MKGRFPILRNFPGQDHQAIYETIEALFILHNILEEFGDDPTEIDGYNGFEDATEGADVDENILHDRALRIQVALDEMDEADMYQTGLHRRKQLLAFQR